MKISINVEEEIKDIEVVISCSRLPPEIEKVLATLRMMKDSYWLKREKKLIFLMFPK